MVPSKAAVRATYERIAASFASTWRESWPEVRWFIEALPPASRVLDLGCGNGRHSKVLAEFGHQAVALDFSRALLTIGRRDISTNESRAHIAWVEGEATKLPVRASSFDACVCVALLHHLPTVVDRIVALREMRRILRRGAPVFVSVWARDQMRFDAFPGARSGEDGDVEVPWKMPDGNSVPRFYHLFREGELERTIIEAGLHGERFFRGAGNWFGLARTDG